MSNVAVTPTLSGRLGMALMMDINFAVGDQEALTTLARVSSSKLASNPPCITPSWPQRALPKWTKKMASELSFFTMATGRKPNLPVEY